MALGYQARASQRVLSRLGEDALLDGAPAGKANIARQVEIAPGIGDTADDNHVLRFDIATLSKSYNPRVGKTLQVFDRDGAEVEGSPFVLDRMVGDNGFNMQFIVVSLT